jgi:hypothetical protein
VLQDGYLECSSIGDGGRFLLDVGLGLRLGTRKLGGDRELFRAKISTGNWAGRTIQLLPIILI